MTTIRNDLADHKSGLSPADPLASNPTRIQFPEAARKAAVDQNSMEIFKRRMKQIEVADSMMLIFLLCLQPLLVCYRTDLYKEEKRKLMLGAGWFLHGLRPFLFSCHF